MFPPKFDPWLNTPRYLRLKYPGESDSRGKVMGVASFLALAVALWLMAR